MKKTIGYTLLLLCALSMHAQNLCGGIYTDSGGEFADYSNNQNTSKTLSPLISGGKVTVSFTEFNTEENVDYLKIYDGYPGGNAPLIGTYSGNNSPGTITATSANGVLTFVFVSNDSVTMPGWKANVTCTPPCTTTNALNYVHGTDPGSIVLSWTQTVIPDHWELIIQNPTDPEPTASSTGTVVTTNPYLVTGLIEGQGYKFYLRSVCDGNVDSPVSAWKSVTILRYFNKSTNDECSNATPLIVNEGAACTTSNFGTISGATPSADPSPCFLSDDVWYSFTATSPRHIITLTNDVGSLVRFTLYKGTCDNLALVGCYYLSEFPTVTCDYEAYEVGATYYIRVNSGSDYHNIYSFNICVVPISTCATAPYFCGSDANEPYIFESTVGAATQGSLACLGAWDNPAFYTLKVTESGPLVYSISENTNFDAAGNPLGNALDADFVAWGPFSSADNCSDIAWSGCSCPNNTDVPYFYPFGNIVDCSYEDLTTAPKETLHIPNAVAGEYYKVMVTNYNNLPGFIKLEQSNFNTPGSGKTVCADRLQLIAFVDLNSNGIKDLNEYNFSLGTFNYQINNTGETIVGSSASGKYNINYADDATTYDVSYQIFPEYSAYYTMEPTNYNDLSIALNSGAHFIYFPITLTQTYTDVSVAVVPMGQPIAGSTYKNKMVYKNNGSTTTSGTLAFVKPPGTTIGNVSQSTNIYYNATGFHYEFTNLAPFETRSVIVTMNVPAIPTVNINDLLTTNVSVTTTGDINLSNNSDTNTQFVAASYDPNDKTEAHGNKILISDFDAADDLNYTIRFENTGTSNAVNVRLEDLLDVRLDEQSIRMTDASHDYNMARTGHKVVWSFTGLQLKPTMQDEAMSKGYITFKIKPRPGFAVGDIIPNAANIFFDSNPAIETNTFNTEFVNALPNVDFISEDLLLYPNPTRQMVQINLTNRNDTIKILDISDVTGKSILKLTDINASHQTINVSHFKKGVYFVSIVTQSNLKQIKKLIIE